MYSFVLQLYCPDSVRVGFLLSARLSEKCLCCGDELCDLVTSCNVTMSQWAMYVVNRGSYTSIFLICV